MARNLPRRMKVLVLQDHEHLGEVGKIVDVKPGYARNYLYPQGLACALSDDALRRVEKGRKEAAAVRARHAADLAALAKTLDGISLTIEERASEEGHLFGSVGSDDIVAALRGKGVTVDAKRVVLEGPIKELGIFNVPIRLDAETTAEVRVWVVEPTA